MKLAQALKFDKSAYFFKIIFASYKKAINEAFLGFFEYYSYRQILNFFDKSDFLFMCPQIVVGGADKMIIEYTKAASSEYSACLITSLETGCWIGQICVPRLDLNTQCLKWGIINEEKKLKILLKAIIKSKIRHLHIINSEIALQLVKNYDDVLKKHGVKIITSFFCPDYDWQNDRFHGFPIMYPEIFQKSNIILTDNKCWIPFFKKLAGVEFNYKKLYVPIDQDPRIKKDFSIKKRILWASRICNQKLMPVLFQICQAMPEHTFVIYGSEPHESLAQEYFAKLLQLKNVEFRGTYKRNAELNFDEFDLCLFTSKFEGLGIVRVDVINHLLPLITSAVGEIDFLENDQNFLVNDLENAEEYCTKIEKFYQYPSYYFEKTRKLKKNLQLNHNEEKFKQDYLESLLSIN